MPKSPKLTKLVPKGMPRREANGRLLYSQVVVVEAGRLAFVAGQLARDAAGNHVGKGDMAAQIRQVGENLRVALAAVGATTADLVKTTTYVTDLDAFFAAVDARTDFFGTQPPTSTTVQVSRLSHPDFLVEIEAIAALGSE
jgi:enamine deaminase RidA (YjgF/YER057c/UK114 family)